ncbi:MAG TPA: hypothetical protein VGP63_24175, partial [Planctomycetaceae bacterium]|nr:hypothetical protein [Planctomycetaceae bacterium]
IVPSWLLSLVLHAGLFALLAVSLPGLRGGIVGDPDGDLRSVGIWVGRSGDGSDGDGSGTGSAKAAAGETKLVPAVKGDQLNNQVPSTAPTPTTVPDVSGSFVRPEISPSAVLDPVVPSPVAPTSVAVSPVLGPGPRPDRRGLYQPSQPGSAVGKSGGADSGSGGGRRGSRGSTPFFGIVDVGSRFVYLIDCSGSMYSHNAMGAAKNELLKSLRTLNRFQQFQVVFYNTEQKWLKAPGKVDFRFFSADEKTLRLASEFIGEIDPDGGTQHVTAIQLALRLHPDVIFFLTDGGKPGLSPFDLEELKRTNDRHSRIHCVQFSSADDPDAAAAADFLEKLAAQSDGEYVCRDVSRFDTPIAAPGSNKRSGKEH